MSETAPADGLDDEFVYGYAAIGRRSVPKAVNDLPASGTFWKGPTRFVVEEERPGAFRWVMVSGDGRNLELAQSDSLFASAEDCAAQVRRLDPSAEIIVPDRPMAPA